MALDNLVTRFPNGSNNVFDNNIFANLKVNDRTVYHEFYDDFDKYTAAQWTTGGVGAPVAPVLLPGDMGILSLSNSAADNDNNWLQQAVAAWSVTVGKKMFFRARGQVDDATQSDVVFGLQAAVVANNFLTPANGIFFRKDDDAASVVLVHRAAGVETVSASLGVLANGTPFELSWAYDGLGNYAAALNGQVRASITPAATIATVMLVIAGVQNGTAVSRALQADQLFCVKER